MTRSIKTTLTACVAAAALLAIPAGAHADSLRVVTPVGTVPVPATVDCPDTSQFAGTRVDPLIWIQNIDGDTWVFVPYVIVVCDKW